LISFYKSSHHQNIRKLDFHRELAIETCTLQNDCLRLTSVDTTTNGCLWEVCLEFDSSKEGCKKEDEISHVGYVKDPCDENEACTSVLEFQAGAKVCTTVGPKTPVKFVVKDGNAGGDCVPLLDAVQGGWSCGNNVGDLECSGSGNDGKECLWSFTTPEADEDATCDDHCGGGGGGGGGVSNNL
jgi:hypothetical protein